MMKESTGQPPAPVDQHPHSQPMTTITCLLATVLALLSIPFVLLFRITESRHTTIQRWRRQGQTWKTISTRLGVSPSTARRWATA